MAFRQDPDVYSSKKSQPRGNRECLLDEIDGFVESIAFLRTQLQRYETTMVDIARRLENCEPGVTAANNISTQRRQVTEAIEEFEAVYPPLLLAWFALGTEEGASISEIGRVLGISPQLASRLAGEVASSDRRASGVRVSAVPSKSR